MKKNSLLITSNLPVDHVLFKWGIKNNWEIQSASFLRFEFFAFTPQCPFEVVFFSSIRSFEGFISAYPIYDGAIEFACIGGLTKQKIKERGYPVHFVGENAGNPSLVAEEFKQWLGERRVLFPVSKQSAQSIAKVIEENQKEEIVVYSSEPISVKVELHQYLVFTSPTNFKAFLNENVISKEQRIIAWGETTKSAIIRLNFAVFHTLTTSTYEELIAFLDEVSN